MMFSLYNFILFTLFVYFALFLHTFVLFFEDLFLIIAFVIFLVIIFQLISTATTTYFAERATYIRLLYAKLFARRKEAITKNKILIKQLYLEQDSNLISQYAALFYLKHLFNVKVYKEIEIKAQQTAVQSLFIEKQQDLTMRLRTLVGTQPKNTLNRPIFLRKIKIKKKTLSTMIPGPRKFHDKIEKIQYKKREERKQAPKLNVKKGAKTKW